MPHPTFLPRRRERGSYLVPFSLLMVVMTFSGAYAVDLGVLHLSKQQLRLGVDSAAAAGATYLDGTSDGIAAARGAAVAAAQANYVRGEPLQLDAGDITFGRWDTDTGAFVQTGDPARVDALRVETTVRDIPTPFSGAAMGTKSRDLTLDAIGARPAPEPVGEADCFLPVAIPKCALDELDDDGQGVLQLRLGNDGSDTAGWGHPDGANASNVSAAMYGAATGQCARSNSPVVSESDRFPVMNGISTRVLRDTGELLKDSAQSWDTELWGRKPSAHPASRLSSAQYRGAGIIQGPIPIVNGGGNCNKVKFNGSKEVVQLAWGVIFDAYTGKGQDKGVQVLIDTEHTFEVTGTGSGIGEGSGNVTVRPAGRLVQ